MQRLERKTAELRWPNDVDFIVNECVKAGYDVSGSDAEWAWGEWCESHYCAGWLSPEHYPVVDAMLEYLTPTGGPHDATRRND